MYVNKKTVADPEFPRDGGVDPGGGVGSVLGSQNTILPNFTKNCMKLKEFWRMQNFTM